jgi:chromosome segregation ATPase
MNLDRKFLEALGIKEDATQEQICNAHQETLSRVKSELDEANNKVAELDKTLKAVTKERDTLKTATDSGENGLQAKYDKLEKEYSEYKANVEKEADTRKKTAAYRDLLKTAGISEKRLDSILRISDLSGIKLDKEGKIVDSDSLSEKAKTEWADFIEHSEKNGVDPATPPGNIGGKLSRADIYKKDDNGRYLYDATTRQQKLAELMQAGT